MAMTPIELRDKLIGWAEENAGVDERRYLHMSLIGRCAIELYQSAVDGREFEPHELRFIYEGQVHRADLIKRLSDMHLYKPGRELVAPFDDRFRGHTQGEVDGMLLLVKSVSQDKFDEVANSRRALRQDYEQVQVYMLYGGWDKAMVIYKCRDSGKVFPISTSANETVQARLEEKAKAVLAAMDAGQEPVCTCGRH